MWSLNWKTWLERRKERSPASTQTSATEATKDHKRTTETWGMKGIGMKIDWTLIEHWLNIHWILSSLFSFLFSFFMSLFFHLSEALHHGDVLVLGHLAPPDTWRPWRQPGPAPLGPALDVEMLRRKTENLKENKLNWLKLIKIELS